MNQTTSKDGYIFHSPHIVASMRMRIHALKGKSQEIYFIKSNSSLRILDIFSKIYCLKPSWRLESISWTHIHTLRGGEKTNLTSLEENFIHSVSLAVIVTTIPITVSLKLVYLPVSGITKTNLSCKYNLSLLFLNTYKY